MVNSNVSKPFLKLLKYEAQIHHSSYVSNKILGKVVKVMNMLKLAAITCIEKVKLVIDV